MARPSKVLNVVVWIVQALLALVFVGTGLWKLLTPIPELASKMPWMGQVSPTFLYAIAVIDILGGLGLVLPPITRIWPRLAAVAAMGCAALQVCAAVFHMSRGEGASTPFNVLLIALSLFVAWARWRDQPTAQ